MNQSQFEKFVNYLLKQKWQIFGPAKSAAPSIKEDEEEISPFLAAHLPGAEPKKTPVFIRSILKPQDLVLDGSLPFYSFKRFFVPEKETLFEYYNFNPPAPFYKGGGNRIALMGVNLLDLRAINLYDQVFEKDSYYQARRKNILIIGYSITPEINDNIFEYKFEEDILEHLPFDIFLAEHTPTVSPPLKGGEKEGVNSFKIFTSSIKGQRILDHFGYKDFEHIQYSGPIKEGVLDERLIMLKNKLEQKHNPKIWEKYGARCIECGKCTLACPTCFCFRIDDEPESRRSGARWRCWDSCYYPEFSEVGGPETPGKGKPKFLKNTAERIHFWYFHKFARIPREFDFMGCVGCRRCARVCPAGIDIAEVLKDVENS